MGLFEAIGEIAAMPIRVAGELVKDISSIGDFDDSDAMLSMFTLGGSSVVKGIGKSITKANNKLNN